MWPTAGMSLSWPEHTVCYSTATVATTTTVTVAATSSTIFCFQLINLLFYSYSGYFSALRQNHWGMVQRVDFYRSNTQTTALKHQRNKMSYNTMPWLSEVGEYTLEAVTYRPWKLVIECCHDVHGQFLSAAMVCDHRLSFLHGCWHVDSPDIMHKTSWQLH